VKEEEEDSDGEAEEVEEGEDGGSRGSASSICRRAASVLISRVGGASLVNNRRDETIRPSIICESQFRLSSNVMGAGSAGSQPSREMIVCAHLRTGTKVEAWCLPLSHLRISKVGIPCAYVFLLVSVCVYWLVVALASGFGWCGGTLTSSKKVESYLPK
jgi:hypothetical protein